MAEALPPRRTACNRCRSHKLRCSRGADLQDTESCQRCLRAGARCITTSAASIRQSPTRAHLLQRRRSRQSRPPVGSAPLTEYSERQAPTPASSITDDNHPSSSCDTLQSDVHNATLQDRHTIPSTSGIVTSISPNSILTRIEDTRGSGIPATDLLDLETLQHLPTPLDKREECVRKLAALHTSLVTDLTTARLCQTADKCTTIIKMPEFSQNYNFMIGRMLQSSARLNEILDYFGSSSTVNTKQDHVHCDTPTMFTVFTCYTYLVRIYRIVLTSVYESVINPPDPPEKLPPLFPGMHLGGYSLESHIDTQVRILVQVCEEMLAKINLALGVTGQGTSGTFQASSEILRLMLDHELAEQHEEGLLRGNSKSLTKILSCLKATCQP